MMQERNAQRMDRDCMKVAVLSDTHNLLRPQVAALLGTCDAVIHAGDIGSLQLMDAVREAAGQEAPAFFVRGNNDGEWAEGLPESLCFTLGGISFFLVHKKKDVPEKLEGIQVIVHGHSHKYMQEEKSGRLWLNPGSCGKRRFNQEITMAFLYLGKGHVQVERVDLPAEPVSGRGKRDLDKREVEKDCRIPEDNLLSAIEGIFRRMDRGWKIERISREMKLDACFVEQVCRIRVTHPGVSAEGIMDKIEVNRQTGAR